MPAQIAKHWPVLLLAILLLAAVTITQYLASTHLMFLPLYLVICILLTWQSGRRFGGWAATVAAALGPLVVGIKDPGYGHLGIFLWNTVMRFIILQMGVLFTHRIREQKDTLHLETGVNLQTVNLANNWAVLLASILFLIGVAGIDFVTDPHVIFLPLYLFPCMLVTLVFNFRWGIGASLIANIASAWVEYDTNSQHTMLETFGWNFAMRFLMFVAVIALLNRIRKEHILFSPHK